MFRALAAPLMALTTPLLPEDYLTLANPLWSTELRGRVVAPALFPIHAIELMPGSRPLDASMHSTGREGSSEVGRNLAARLGLSMRPALNGGSSVELHSLLGVGERVRAESRLAGVLVRESRRAGRLLIVEALNEYRVAGSERLLLRERSRAIHAETSAAGPAAGNHDRRTNPR